MAQARRRLAHGVEAALDVDGEQAVEGGVVRVGQGRQRGRHDAGVVDQHVDAAEGRFGRIEQRLHVARIGHVGLDCDGGAAVGKHACHQLVCRRLAAGVIDDDLHAVARQAAGDGRADAARGARDDGDPGWGEYGMHAASPVVWEARAVCLRAGMAIVIFIVAWIKTGLMVLVCNQN